MILLSEILVLFVIEFTEIPDKLEERPVNCSVNSSHNTRVMRGRTKGINARSAPTA